MPEIGGAGCRTGRAFVPNATRSREVAFDVALAVARDGAYANLALPAALGGAGLSERDRAFVTELVYGSLRAQGQLDAVIEEATRRAMSSLEVEVTTLLRLGVYQVLRMRVETHAAVDESVRLAKTRGLHRVAGLVNAALRAVSAHPAEYWDRVIGQSTTSLHSSRDTVPPPRPVGALTREGHSLFSGGVYSPRRGSTEHPGHWRPQCAGAG